MPHCFLYRLFLGLLLTSATSFHVASLLVVGHGMSLRTHYTDRAHAATNQQDSLKCSAHLAHSTLPLLI